MNNCVGLTKTERHFEIPMHFYADRPKRKENVISTTTTLKNCILYSCNGRHKKWNATRISCMARPMRIPTSGLIREWILCIYASVDGMVIVMFSFLCNSVKVYLTLYHIPECIVLLYCIILLYVDLCIWCWFWIQSENGMNKLETTFKNDLKYILLFLLEKRKMGGNVMKCEGKGQDGQQLVRILRGRGILTVLDCLLLDFRYVSKNGENSIKSNKNFEASLRFRHQSSRDCLRPYVEWH